MRIIYTLLLIAVFCISSCKQSTKVDFQKERAEILRLHDLQREYHFNKDSVAFVNQLSDDFISVNRGEVTFPKSNETQSRYHSYFSSVEFLEWDDVKDPIIRFSEDGKLAYTIVEKIVKLRNVGESKDSSASETHFAWTAIYRKSGGEWKIESVTSTNR